MKSTQRLNSFESKLLRAIIILVKGILFFTLILNSANLAAQSNDAAVKQTIKALRQTPIVKELVQSNKHKVEGHLKDLTEFVGDNAVALIAAGVVAKLAIDGRAAYKAKINKNTTYVVNVDMAGEFATGFNGKVEGLKNSNYDVMAYTNGGDQGMKVGLKFNFD